MISQIPVFSGKTAFSRLPGSVIFPALLGAMVYVALLMTFTWQTLTLSAVAYFATIPLGMRAFRQRKIMEAKREKPKSSDG